MRIILIILLIIISVVFYILYSKYNGGEVHTIIHVSSAPGVDIEKHLEEFIHENRVKKKKSAGKEFKTRTSDSKTKTAQIDGKSMFKIVYTNENINAGYHIHVSYDDFDDPSEIFRMKNSIVSSMPNGIKDWENYISNLSEYNINKVCKPSTVSRLIKSRLDVW